MYQLIVFNSRTGLISSVETSSELDGLREKYFLLLASGRRASLIDTGAKPRVCLYNSKPYANVRWGDAV